MYYYNQIKKETRKKIKRWLNRGNSGFVNSSDYFNFGLINPSIGSSNLGDLIILDAVYNELRSVYPNDLFINFPSQIATNSEAKQLMSDKEYLFVSGTNLLSSNMDSMDQWKLDPMHKRALSHKVILCGVGWWQYQGFPNSYTKELYSAILDDSHLHSVRDSYTLTMLNSIGIENVVNTTCPTFWTLTPAHCSQIPKVKQRDVITTLTFYKPNPELDKRMLEILINNYKSVYLWAQSIEDIHYLNNIFPNTSAVKLIPPTVEAYNNALENISADYVGTRLHAGARALQKKVRSLIVAVDNRASEIANDINLNVIKRENLDEMLNFIEKPYQTDVHLPLLEIKKWKNSLPRK